MSKGSNPSMYNVVKSMTKAAFSQFIFSNPKEQTHSEFDYKALDDFCKNSPAVTLVYNHKTLQYDYFSSNIKPILGYDSMDFQNGGLKFAMSLVLPEHTKIYNRHILPIMFRYYTLYAFKGKVKSLRFSYTFKIRRKDGEYIWALHHMNAVKINALGFPQLTIVNITDITDLKTDASINITVSLLDENEMYQTVYSRVYGVDTNFSFSDRESQILELLADGKTNNEISLELNISPHTVKTHRKNMLKKSKVKNTSELILLTSRKNANEGNRNFL